MKNKVFPLMLIVGIVFVVLSNIVWALDDEPLWFLSLEYIGIIISIYALVITYRNYNSMKGGKIGKASKLIAFAIGLILLSFIWRAFLEAAHIEGLFSQVIFEVLWYLAVILILLSSKHISFIMKRNE
ncbi:MAG TPA: hypothetical protein VI564_07810 [Candidatus Nanoarchaeia archaeon]|nr:hypothetical protein [Candidatus Nanoarchaeia archaeon]